MDSIVKIYNGCFKNCGAKVEFTAPHTLETITINGKVYVKNNCEKYGRIKFRNHIMEHVYNIVINTSYKLRKPKFIEKIYSLFSIHSSWNNIEVIHIDNNFILNNFDSSVYKTFSVLDNIYKKKFYIFCYIYIYGGFYIGNSCLKLNYPLAYFVKKRSIFVYNNITNKIYDDFFYAEPDNKLLLKIIEGISNAVFSDNNGTYDSIMGETLFTNVFKSIENEFETQLLYLQSYLKNDIPAKCNYVWINETQNHERYIQLDVSKYLKIKQYHSSKWTY